MESNNPFSPNPGRNGPSDSPLVDIVEYDDTLVIVVDALEFSQEDVTVSLIGGNLQIEIIPTAGGDIFGGARSVTEDESFMIQIPKNIDRESMVSQFKNGVLTVTFDRV